MSCFYLAGVYSVKVPGVKGPIIVPVVSEASYINTPMLMHEVTKYFEAHQTYKDILSVYGESNVRNRGLTPEVTNILVGLNKVKIRSFDDLGKMGEATSLVQIICRIGFDGYKDLIHVETFATFCNMSKEMCNNPGHDDFPLYQKVLTDFGNKLIRESIPKSVDVNSTSNDIECTLISASIKDIYIIDGEEDVCTAKNFRQLNVSVL